MQTLEGRKRGGWVAFGAGIFLMVVIAAVWIWVDHLLAANGIAPGETAMAGYLGRLNVAFLLLVLAGALGVLNGWIMAHTGRPSRMVLIGLFVVFAAAVVLAVTASAQS